MIHTTDTTDTTAETNGGGQPRDITSSETVARGTAVRREPLVSAFVEDPERFRECLES